VRAAQIEGVAVSEGDVIGLLNDKLVASGRDLEAVVRQMLARVGAERYEIVTIYYGAEATEASAKTLAGRIKEWYPNVEVEIVNGGQPYYVYIMSVE
jgi:dihydroxyacetone kinase-like predicted kinase